MFFLLDTILLTQTMATIGFVGLITTLPITTWQNYFSLIIIPLLHFFLSGNTRIVILNNNWDRKKTISFKSVIFMGSIVYFCIGAYIMFTDYKITKGFIPSIDSAFKDFALLYSFSNFSFFNEMFGKISDFDKTSDLLVEYSIKIEDS